MCLCGLSVCKPVLGDVYITREKLLKTNQKEEKLSHASGVLYFFFKVKDSLSLFQTSFLWFFGGKVLHMCVHTCVEFSIFSYCLLCHIFLSILSTDSSLSSQKCQKCHYCICNFLPVCQLLQVTAVFCSSQRSEPY